MDRNFKKSLSCVLKHEGEWSDHPADPGGATMKGITLANYRRYVKKTGTKADLKAITDEQIEKVYYRKYWLVAACDKLPDGVDYAVFDFAVNSGPSRAAKFLQSVVGATQDGNIGPATLAAVKNGPASIIIQRLCRNRLDWLRGLKTFKTFGKGWTSRVVAVEKDALAMAAAQKPADAPKPSPAPSQPARPKPAPTAKPEANAAGKSAVAVIIAAAAAVGMTVSGAWDTLMETLKGMF